MTATSTKPAPTALTRTIKCVGVLLMLVGLVLSAIGILQLFGSTSDVTAGWWRAVSQKDYYGRRHWEVAWGAYLTVAGFMLSFAYNATVSRLVRWVSSRRA
jgi:hypothetical protein